MAQPDPNIEEEASWRNWLLPLESLQDSPSRQDNMSNAEENLYRRKTVIFIEDICSELNVDWQTQTGAQVYFHYYFARHSFKRHLRFNVAVACLFLAAKVEECEETRVRYLPNLIIFSHERYNRRKDNYRKLSLDSEEYIQTQKEVLACERKLLHTLGFDLTVKKPQEYLMTQIRELLEHRVIADNIRSEFGRISWEFLKMSLRTSLCLQVVPPAISAVCISLAAIYFEIEVTPRIIALVSEDSKESSVEKSSLSGESSSSSGSSSSSSGSNTKQWHDLLGVDIEMFKSVTSQIMVCFAENELKGLQDFDVHKFETRLFAMGIVSQVHTKPRHNRPLKNKKTLPPPPPPPPPPSSSTSSSSSSSSPASDGICRDSKRMKT